jgi:hypothetical protein
MPGQKSGIFTLGGKFARCESGSAHGCVAGYGARSPPSGEALAHQIENGGAILEDYFDPGEWAHLREVNAAEAEPGDENVDAVAKRFVLERDDSVGQSGTAIGNCPAPLHFGVSFGDGHS